MPKSTKYQEKVPKLEDYKPSWLKVGEDGEQTVDVAAALKAAYTLTVDKAKAQDAREDATADAAVVTTEKDALQALVDDKNAPDAQAEIAKANKRADAAEATAKTAVAEKTRLEVIVEKGLTPKQAKYLPKDGTKEELEEAADEVKTDFPDAAQPAETDEEREEREEREAEENPLGSRPKAKNLVNPASASNPADGEIDFEKWADQQASGGIKL